MGIPKNSNMDEFKANSDEILKQVATMVRMDFVLIAIDPRDGVAICSTICPEHAGQMFKQMASQIEDDDDININMRQF